MFFYNPKKLKGEKMYNVDDSLDTLDLNDPELRPVWIGFAIILAASVLAGIVMDKKIQQSQQKTISTIDTLHKSAVDTINIKQR